MKKNCPHCNNEIRIRELPHQGLFKSFRICPHCGGSFTVDIETKYRQAYCLLFAVIALIFTMLLYYRSREWLIPALVSYVIVGLIIYRGDKRLFFVPFRQSDRDSTDDAGSARR